MVSCSSSCLLMHSLPSRLFVATRSMTIDNATLTSRCAPGRSDSAQPFELRPHDASLLLQAQLLPTPHLKHIHAQQANKIYQSLRTHKWHTVAAVFARQCSGNAADAAASAPRYLIHQLMKCHKFALNAQHSSASFSGSLRILCWILY